MDSAWCNNRQVRLFSAVSINSSACRCIKTLVSQTSTYSLWRLVWCCYCVLEHFNSRTYIGLHEVKAKDLKTKDLEKCPRASWLTIQRAPARSVWRCIWYVAMYDLLWRPRGGWLVPVLSSQPALRCIALHKGGLSKTRKLCYREDDRAMRAI